MAFIIKCPGCQSSLRIRAEYAGKQIKCPRCTHVLAIPLDDPAAAGEPEAAVPLPSAAEKVRPAAKGAPPPLPAARKERDERDERIEEGEPHRLTKRDRQRDEDDDDDRPRRGSRRRDEDDEDDRPRRGGRRKKGRVSFLPCPRCEAPDPTKVVWTFWGSFYGPALFSHVRCRECGYAYNGRSGRSNIIPATLFVSVTALALFGLLGFIGYMILRATGAIK